MACIYYETLLNCMIKRWVLPSMNSQNQPFLEADLVCFTAEVYKTASQTCCTCGLDSECSPEELDLIPTCAVDSCIMLSRSVKKHLQLNDPCSSPNLQKAALKSYGLMLGSIDLINVSVAELDVLFQK